MNQQSDIRLLNGLKAGDLRSLSKIITLVENSNFEKKRVARDIISKLFETEFNSSSIRIGVTGPPGTGKSTFIEKFGLLLIESGYKVAVLAVDPSSVLTKGSILGDKTRMNELASHPKAYIRPSPTSNVLGGVASATRETMFLCEAAGYEIILIETVGVGQSELIVKSMCDIFLLLSQPGSGDELQGIKKGIVEIADYIAVTKDDGKNAELARESKRFLKNALSISKSGVKSVSSISALTGKGIDELKVMILDDIENQKNNKLFHEKRKLQLKGWIRDLVLSEVHSRYEDYESKEIDNETSINIRTPYRSAQKNLYSFIKKEYENIISN